MMELTERTDLMAKLGHYFLQNNDNLQTCIQEAYIKNAWFTPDFTNYAITQIAHHFLQKDLLEQWIAPYSTASNDITKQQVIGIVMAGNIPLVGFHDFLCVFMYGHKAKIKLSSKDTVLWLHIIHLLQTWDERFAAYISIEPIIQKCDAYIATGNNNTSHYFKQYFAKYPHIIRQNRTSVAVLTNDMNEEDYAHLEDDLCLYFGMGCRNVSQIWVPKDFDFEKMINKLQRYSYFADHHKLRNNYDFQLAMYILNKVIYMSNGALLFVENKEAYAPISVVNYQYYTSVETIIQQLNQDQIQCIVSTASMQRNLQEQTSLPIFTFGQSQVPGLSDYADGVNVMNFLQTL